MAVSFFCCFLWPAQPLCQHLDWIGVCATGASRHHGSSVLLFCLFLCLVWIGFVLGLLARFSAVFFLSCFVFCLPCVGASCSLLKNLWEEEAAKPTTCFFVLCGLVFQDAESVVDLALDVFLRGRSREEKEYLWFVVCFPKNRQGSRESLREAYKIVCRQRERERQTQRGRERQTDRQRQAKPALTYTYQEVDGRLILPPRVDNICLMYSFMPLLSFCRPLPLFLYLFRQRPSVIGSDPTPLLFGNCFCCVCFFL